MSSSDLVHRCAGHFWFWRLWEQQLWTALHQLCQRASAALLQPAHLQTWTSKLAGKGDAFSQHENVKMSQGAGLCHHTVTLKQWRNPASRHAAGLMEKPKAQWPNSPFIVTTQLRMFALSSELINFKGLLKSWSIRFTWKLNIVFILRLNQRPALTCFRLLSRLKAPKLCPHSFLFIQNDRRLTVSMIYKSEILLGIMF